jgi:hypothetical protein
MQAILFGFGTLLSPPLAASPALASAASPLGLRFRLFRPLFPVGRDMSLKYPSGGVFELEDILSAILRRVWPFSKPYWLFPLDLPRRKPKDVDFVAERASANLAATTPHLVDLSNRVATLGQKGLDQFDPDLSHWSIYDTSDVE